MIDDFSILLSTMLCVFVIFRAVRLDRTLPWYAELKREPRRSKSKLHSSSLEESWDTPVSIIPTETER